MDENEFLGNTPNQQNASTTVYYLPSLSLSLLRNKLCVLGIMPYHLSSNLIDRFRVQLRVPFDSRCFKVSSAHHYLLLSSFVAKSEVGHDASLRTQITNN